MPVNKTRNDGEGAEPGVALALVQLLLALLSAFLLVFPTSLYSQDQFSAVFHAVNVLNENTGLDISHTAQQDKLAESRLSCQFGLRLGRS